MFGRNRSRAYYRFKNSVFYLTFIRLNNRYKDIVVGNDSDFVVEGFPRSANTFASELIEKVSSPTKPKLARHVHSKAQIITGVKKGIPTILLVREPKYAIASLLIKSCAGSSIKEMERQVPNFVYYYRSFYSGLINYKDKIVVLEFDRLVSDPRKSIQEINRFFLLNLESGFNNEVMTNNILHLIKAKNSRKVGYDVKQLAVPSTEKKELQDLLVPLICRCKGYTEAQSVYEELKN